MTAYGGGEWFISKELRASIAAVQAQINQNLNLPSTQVTAAIAAMNQAPIRAAAEAVAAIHTHGTMAAEVQRISAQLRAATAESRAMKQVLTDVEALTSKYFSATAADLATRVSGAAFVAQIARAAELDFDLVGSLYNEVEQATDEELEADELLAPVRRKPISDFTAAQTEAALRFLRRWAPNFGFDHMVLSAVFADDNLVQVLHWSAMLAIVQAIVLKVLLPPAKDGE